MHLPIFCPSTLVKGLLLIRLSLWMPYVQAERLNFSATIMPSTCTFSLSEGILDLGVLPLFSLKPQTLFAAKPFTLKVSNCSGIQAGLLPVVSITGDGKMSRGGRWFFRAAGSTAKNVGVMLVNSSVMPGYSSTEVKSGDTIALGQPGRVPANQNHSFYAGAMTDEVRSDSIGAGTLIARITFSLEYQ